MGFADPQVVTFPTAGAVSMPRTGSGINAGSFRSASGNTWFDISHQYTKRNRARRTARLNFKKLSADPLVTGQFIEHVVSCYIVVDAPITGLTAAELKDITDGFATWMTATSAANMVKLHGGEN